MTARNCSKVQHPEKTGLITTPATKPPALLTKQQAKQQAKSRLKLCDPTPFSVEFLAQHVPANDAHYQMHALQA